MRSSSSSSWGSVAGLPAWALALALAACGAPEPDERTWLVAMDPGADALVRALGWTGRLLPPDVALGASDRALWLLGPEDADPGAPAGHRVRRSALVTFDEIFELSREIGAWLGREAAAERWIGVTQQRLAALSASSLGRARPHVGIVLAIDPLRLAGALRFEAELVEIAGAENLGHGSATLEVAIDALPPEHRSPDLWLFVPPEVPDEATRSRLRSQLPGSAPLEVFPLPPSWPSDIVGHAERLRARIEAAVQKAKRRPATNESA